MTAERHIGDDERLAVCGALARLGIEATHEYPGVVAIPAAGGRAAWTGMHSWTYASWVDAGGEPDEQCEAAPAGLTEAEADPEVIARAWAAVVVLTIGTRVCAIFPNARWGEGVIEEVRTNPKLKPYVVRRDDGRVGYFHADQIKVA